METALSREPVSPARWLVATLLIVVLNVGFLDYWHWEYQNENRLALERFNRAMTQYEADYAKEDSLRNRAGKLTDSINTLIRGLDENSR